MKQKEFMETILACATVALALFTVGLAIATFWLVSESRKSSYREIGVQTWLELQKRFDSPEMVRARKKLAPQLENYDATKTGKISETVLNFFEDMGSAYRMGYLDKKLADSSFSYHASRWWEAAKPYVEQERRRHGEDKTIFEDFQFVAEQMRLPDEKIDANELRTFLEDESRLVSD
jgi:hypothetical protein